MSKEETPKEKTHVKIKGKVYEYVASRVKKFRAQEEFKGYGIETRLIENDRTNGFVVVQATIKTKEGQIIGQGVAEEDRSKGSINKTSALENCETSAIGRALANIGLAGNEYASAFEMENIPNKEKAKASQDKAKKVADDEENKMILTVHKLLTVSVEGTDDLSTMRNNWKANKEALHIMQEKYPDMYSDLEKAFIEKSKKLKEKENG